MEAILIRSGFHMRPTLVADRQEIAEHIFGDVQVAKTLVHNVSSPEGALVATDAWINTLAVDSERGAALPEYLGLWTIRDETNIGKFVGIRGVFVAPGLPANSVATFVAVARTYWGLGVSGDSSALLCRQVFEKSNLNSIYTRVWPMLNPASDAVQRRLGFVPAERHTLRNTFGEERMFDVLEFDLWRASILEQDGFDETFRQISIRIGQLVAEELLDQDEAEDRIISALPDDLKQAPGICSQISHDLQIGIGNPAWASYRMTRYTSSL